MVSTKIHTELSPSLLLLSCLCISEKSFPLLSLDLGVFYGCANHLSSYFRVWQTKRLYQLSRICTLMEVCLGHSVHGFLRGENYGDPEGGGPGFLLPVIAVSPSSSSFHQVWDLPPWET